MKKEELTVALTNAINSLKNVKVELMNELKVPSITDSILSEVLITKESQKSKESINSNFWVDGGCIILGESSLIYGLVANKIIFTVGGCIVAALGAIKGVRDYVNSQKAQSTKSEETSIDYDYSRLKNRVYNKVSQIGVSVTKSWDEVVEANHTKLNSVILTSDYSEQFKSVLLSIVSKEVTFSNSSSDLLAKMSVAAKKEDLTMLKQVEEEYFTTLKNKLNESYKEQLFVYEKLLNQIELGEGDSSKELAKELR